MNIYEKGVEILDKGPKKPIRAYPGLSKYQNSKNTPFRGEILNIYEKGVDIFDERSKKPTCVYPGCSKGENSKIPLSGVVLANLWVKY